MTGDIWQGVLCDVPDQTPMAVNDVNVIVWGPDESGEQRFTVTTNDVTEDGEGGFDIDYTSDPMKAAICSSIPNPDPCGQGGFNFFFSVDMVNGSSPDEPEVDTNGDGIIDDNDRVSDGNNTGVMAARSAPTSS